MKKFLCLATVAISLQSCTLIKILRTNAKFEKKPINKILSKATPSTPFQFINNRILIDATIYQANNRSINHKGVFIFDTGAFSAIQEAVAEEIKAVDKKVRKADLKLDNGTAFSEWAGCSKYITYQVGSHEITKKYVKLHKKSIPTQSNKLPISGVIGSDMVQDFCVNIDFANKEISISPSNKNKKFDENAAKLLPTNFARIPYVKSKINNVEFRRTMLDTGNPLSILISYNSKYIDTIKKIINSIAPNQIIAYSGYSGVGNVQKDMLGNINGKSYEVLVDSIQIGNKVIKGKINILLIEHNKIRKFDCNIGNGLLQYFNVTLDYGSRKLFLTQQKPIQDTLSKKMLMISGIAPYKVIMYRSDIKIFEKIQVDDELISINGIATNIVVGKYTTKGNGKLFNSGDVLEFKNQHGEIYQITHP